MKKLLIIPFLLFFSTHIYSQLSLKSDLEDCSNFVKTVTDEFTDESTISINDYIISANKDSSELIVIDCFISNRSNKPIVAFMPYEINRGRTISHCIKENAVIYLIYRDGSKEQILQNGGFNCDSVLSVYFSGIFKKSKTLNNFLNKEIEKIRVETTEGFIESEITKEDGDRLRKAFNCMVNYQ